MPPQHPRPLLSWAFAFCSVACMGGVVYGWPSMRKILLRDGTLDTCNATLADEALLNGTTIQCKDEELAFGLIFTVGATANQGGRFFVGIFLDRFGPRLTSSGCAILCALGSLLFGFASSTAALSIGLLFIGMGGAGTQLAVQSVSALFPEHRSLVMASLSGAFMLGGGIFLLFELAHQGGAGRSGLMCGHAVLALCLAIAAVIMLPSRPFGAPAKPLRAAPATRVDEPVVAVMVDDRIECSQASADERAVAVVPLRSRSFRGQVTSAEFWLNLLMFTGNAMQCQFTVASIGAQLELKGDASGDGVRFFSSVLALTFVATPFIGHAFDRLGFPRVMVAVNSANLLVPALLLSDSLELQHVTSVVYGLGRVSQWATFFAFTGATFGFANFGKLAGLGLLLQSSISLVQYPLLSLTFGPMDSDFTFVNGLFVSISLVLYAVPATLWWRERRGREGPAGPGKDEGDPAPAAVAVAVLETESKA